MTRATRALTLLLFSTICVAVLSARYYVGARNRELVRLRDLEVQLEQMNALVELLSSLREVRQQNSLPHLPPGPPGPNEGKDLRAFFIGDPDECKPWTLDALYRLAPGAPDPSDYRWNDPLRLGYTVAPLHCLSRMAWDHSHLINGSEDKDVNFFLHSMKTGGTSLRQTWGKIADAYKPVKAICLLYNWNFRLIPPGANSTIVSTCMHKWNVGHLGQLYYHNKFPQGPLYGKTGFYFLGFRDPLMRARSVYDYFTVLRDALYMDGFFTTPGRTFALAKAKSSFWAQDIFWYMGVEPIRSNDTVAMQIDKLERCKFGIRSVVPLIAERPLESLALISTALGGQHRLNISCAPIRLNERYGDESRLVALNLTRHGMRVGMAKMRHARVLYEYAVQIFELRLQQFGIPKLVERRCTRDERYLGGVGGPVETSYMDAFG